MSLNTEYVVVMAYEGDSEPAFCQTVEAPVTWDWSDVAAEAVELALGGVEDHFEVVAGFMREAPGFWIECGSKGSAVESESVNCTYVLEAEGKSVQVRTETSQDDVVVCFAAEVLQTCNAPLIKSKQGCSPVLG